MVWYARQDCPGNLKVLRDFMMRINFFEPMLDRRQERTFALFTIHCPDARGYRQWSRDALHIRLSDTQTSILLASNNHPRGDPMHQNQSRTTLLASLRLTNYKTTLIIPSLRPYSPIRLPSIVQSRKSTSISQLITHIHTIIIISRNN